MVCFRPELIADEDNGLASVVQLLRGRRGSLDVDHIAEGAEVVYHWCTAVPELKGVFAIDTFA